MQKPFGNLKKYIPADIASVPAVRIRYCIIGFSISFEFIGLLDGALPQTPPSFLRRKKGERRIKTDFFGVMGRVRFFESMI